MRLGSLMIVRGEGEVMGAGVEGYLKTIFVGIIVFLILSDK